MGIRSLLILCISLLLFGVEIDRKLLSQSKYLDVVTLTGADAYVVYLQKLPLQEHYVATPLDKVLFKPEWKFYPHKASGQIIAVAELAPKDQWFNAAIYNTLSLQGSCKECQVALADKILFSKEDNYIVGDFQQNINLDILRERIDLRHLKYLVLLIKEKQDLKVSGVTFENHFDVKAKTSSMRSVWIWKSQDIDLAVLHKNSIRRIYLQIDDGFEKHAKILYNEGFEVYALDGDPHDIFDAKRLYTDIDRIVQLNVREQVISGFQIDVEPHVLKAFDIHQEEYLHAFATLVNKLTQRAHNHTLAFSIVTPFWYDSLIYKKRPLIYQLIDMVDETVLMSYRSDANSVLRLSADELAYASYHHKKIQIGIELMPIADENHTIYTIEGSTPCIVETALEEACAVLKVQKSYRVKGKALSLYGQPKALKQLLSTPIVYPAFEGFVFHHVKGLQ